MRGLVVGVTCASFILALPRPFSFDQPIAYLKTLGGVALFLAVSFALRLYLHYFNSYSKTYGSLGAVIVLLLWLYISGLAIMVGGEINSEIENAAAKRGHPEAKEPGEKAA